MFFAAVVEKSRCGRVGVGVLHGGAAVGAVVGIERLVLRVEFEQAVDDDRDLAVERLHPFLGRRVGSIDDCLRFVDDRVAGFASGLSVAEDLAGIFWRDTLRWRW